ncbi:MAG: MBL fold metallo-hydrolase [Tidjanibacter sp.]|nr:MBL fold metallo-hydrolase [Tidjanibacter sp.]
MIDVARFEFNLFGENTYVVSDASGECIVVDAGNSRPEEDDALLNYLERKSLKPIMAVCTHAHPDHTAGLARLLERYPMPLALHSDDLALLEALPAVGRKYGFSIPPLAIGQDLRARPEILFGRCRLTAIHTPGHSRGSVCLFDAEDGILFSGDTIFRGSIGRTDLAGGDYDQLIDSIINNILPLGDAVKVLPGHGDETSIGNEALYNPFITEVIGGGFNHNTLKDEN